MKVKGWIKLGVIGFLGLALTGCASNKINASGSGYGRDSASVRAYDSDSSEFEGYSSTDSWRQREGVNQSFYFDFDCYELSATDKEDLKVQAEYLVSHPQAKVRLEGNTDLRGSREYNVALGWKRANAVAQELRNQGVRNSQIAVVSFGKEKPVANGNDEESHRKNRRVDLIFEQR